MVGAPQTPQGHAGRLSQHASNTLILADLPPQLFEPGLNAILRSHFEPVRLWASLQGFGRIMVVYSGVMEAARVKLALDKSIIEDADGNAPDSPDFIPTVYFGPDTPESMLAKGKANSLAQIPRLPVPVTDKNFLISPPGSPPVGWEQIREDPPNQLTLADDLMAALQGLALAEVQQVASSEEEGRDEIAITAPTTKVEEKTATPKKTSRTHSRSDTLIISSPADASFPSVLVSDLDADDEEERTSGITIANTPRGIQRPPPIGSISQVKATVESMQTAARITPTARPPVS